jgi:ABC-type transport system involved in cytochrome c biogenesis permease subunit
VGYNVWGITQRCIINERPPIATLYETILFITGVVAIVGLFIERFTRQGIGLVVAGFVGALGMFAANRFMALDARDTMPTLEAVLITNFWLATHVTCINIGYAGAMLGSITSMVYVIYRLFARGELAIESRKLLTRIVYGIVCFGVLFALVGTVLGGIWANDSWGRFWGWDPKENGALMIVLMGLIILHARLGGYIREIGLHALSLMLGAITLFSWFGVNQLGVGLHSYGFTAGISLALNTGYSIKFIFMFICLCFWWNERAAKRTLA